MQDLEDTPPTVCCNVLSDVEYTTLSLDEQQLILQLQQDILEAVAQGGDTAATVDRICLHAERLLPNSVATVMLLDEAEGLLDLYAAPNVPPEGRVRLRHLRPGPGAGSCGNAVYREEPQFVRNTFTDQRWVDLRQFAYDFDIRACWSMPIRAPEGKTVGSFALSSFEHRAPGNFHRKVLEVCASITGIVLERGKSEETLRLFGNTIAGISEGVVITDTDHKIVMVNQAFTEILGYSLEEVTGKSAQMLYAGDRGEVSYQQVWDHITTHGSWRGEIRSRRKSGEVFPEWLSISAVRNAVGDVTHYIAIFSDASEYHETRRRMEAEHTLRENIIESIPAAFYLYDGSRRPLLTNQYWMTTLGLEKADFLSSRLGDYVHPDDRAKVLAAAEEAYEGKTVSIEFRSLSKNGKAVPHLLNITGFMIDGEPHLLGIALDISENKRIEASLAHESEKNRFILRNASDGIHILDAEGNLLEASDSFCEMLGYIRDELIGMNVSQWDALMPPYALKRALASQMEETTRQQFETRHRRKDGKLIDVEVSGMSMMLDGQRVIFNSSRDITARKRAEAQTQYLAYHDPLTGLPNRALFLDRLDQAQASARRAQRYGAVMFVDLDQFKRINDVHGHQLGDAVLREMALRLAHHLSLSDTVARFGGDEFVLLLPELGDTQEAAATQVLTVGDKVRAALAEPVTIGGRNYFTTASIGVALFPKQDESGSDLIREADIAMFRAKDSGRNALLLFEQDMQVSIARRYALEHDLREAIDKGELALHLQSQFDANGMMVGGEALVRWNHPTQGLLTPDTFISLAEETGLIIPIGQWVLRETCRLLIRLQNTDRPTRIAVNVSPRQFRQENFVAQVKDVLDETGADPTSLTFEITENLLVEPVGEAANRMRALAALGIRFSIDDFGTGYSSLAYLKSLPLKELKIDKSFVRDVPDDANDVALVETILSMAHHMGFTVVAEGVETAVQADFLRQRRCECFQGFLFQRPEPVAQWLAALEGTPEASSMSSREESTPEATAG